MSSNHNGERREYLTNLANLSAIAFPLHFIWETNSKKIDCQLFMQFYECVFYGIEIIYDLNLFRDDFAITCDYGL